MGNNIQTSENCPPKELFEYGKLIDLANEGTIYRTLNGNPVVSLPIQVPQGVSVTQMLEDMFTKYEHLIRWYGSFSQNDIDFIDDVCEKIINILNDYLTGDVIKAYDLFSGMMNSYGDLFPYKDVEDDIIFYRMRKDMDKSEEKDFYHLPTTMRDKCSSERFSIAGYPCFYLGYSKNDCFVEISKTGSMIGMKLNEKGSLKVLDLTFSKEQEKGDKMKDYLRAFPLIASCYVVFMNNVDSEKAKFREEYVIPQMLTSYLRHGKKFDGICYYSVRNENLNPLGRDKDDYRNLVLFPNLISSEEHDSLLMKKFHWFKPFNVK